MSGMIGGRINWIEASTDKVGSKAVVLIIEASYLTEKTARRVKGSSLFGSNDDIFQAVTLFS